MKRKRTGQNNEDGKVIAVFCLLVTVMVILIYYLT